MGYCGSHINLMNPNDKINKYMDGKGDNAN